MKTRSTLCITLALALLLGAVGALAQNKIPEDKTAKIVLGIGDVIQVTVRNHDDMNAVVAIPTNGKIILHEAGEIQAAGCTAKELESRITAELDKLYNNIFVIVSVREVHSRQIRLLGAVR